MALHVELKQLMERRMPLDRAGARQAMQQILDGQASEAAIAALLGAMGARGETAEELAGFAEAMRGVATPLPLTAAERLDLVDTCGTGGDGSGTFNISTAAALVAAAAGATVAKHGNRAVTSLCGSADVLEAMGVPVDLSPEAAGAALRRNRFAFLHAPSLHPAMRAVMPVRRALGVRTIFNVLGPLTNPAGAARQVMGVYAASLVPVVAQAMALLGTHRALVVHGQAEPGESATKAGATARGLDELSLSGTNVVAEVREGAVRSIPVDPEAMGLREAPAADLRGGDATTNALILRAIFAGETGARRDIVVLNAGAVLWVADRAPDLLAAVRLAERTIDAGLVTELIQALGSIGS